MSGWTGGPHPGRRLSDDQVREIFTLYRGGLKADQVGERVGVGRSVVLKILHRSTYKDVEVPSDSVVILRGPPKGTPNQNRKFTDDQVREMRRLAREGLTFKRIADLLGYKPTTVSYIVRRRGYKNVADEAEPTF